MEFSVPLSTRFWLEILELLWFVMSRPKVWTYLFISLIPRVFSLVWILFILLLALCLPQNRVQFPLENLSFFPSYIFPSQGKWWTWPGLLDYDKTLSCSLFSARESTLIIRALNPGWQQGIKLREVFWEALLHSNPILMGKWLITFVWELLSSLSHTVFRSHRILIILTQIY